ncbi:MAG: hypothetical protein ACPGWR_31865 [Ardenticatenaceae bacterium]
MKGMIDGRRLKHAWDRNQLGALLLGTPPYDYEAGADTQAKFTRVRQVSDFLRCRTPAQRQRVLPATIAQLEGSHDGWAKAGALFLKHIFGAQGQEKSPNVNMPK